ncbi:MAG: TolC family outer membrane protein [Methylophilus sp.]|nr:TolC family outer membrane protein [Methylophilus sp.]
MKKSNSQIHFLSGFILTFFSLSVGAQPLTTLKEMVEKVVTANPEVQAKYHEYTAAGYERDVAHGNFLPKADIVSTYRNQEDKPGSSVSRANGTAIPKFNNELVLRQMIFDGFATSNEVKRLDHAKRVRYYELHSAMENTTLEFMRSYLDTLRYRELTEFAKTNYVVHKQLYDKIKERVDAGVARRVDLEQASGRLALAEANLLTDTTNLHDVTTRMQRLLGEIPPDILEHPSFVNSNVESTAVEALHTAYLQNPDILSTIEDIQATQKEVNTKEAKYLPRLDLQARKNLGTSDDGRNSTNAADVLELTMNFNLFNGFSDKAAISQTVEKLNRSNDLRDKACVDTRQLVNLAYNDIKQNTEQLKYRELHRTAIENAREAYQKQFDIGQRTLLDLLDSENEYFQAKRSYTNTEYDKQIAYARLFAAQGQLVNKIGSARQGLPDLNREAYADAATICEATAPEQITIDKEALLANAKPLTIVNKPVIKPVEKAEPVIVLSDKVIPDVQFETNSAKIKPVSYPVLDNAIKTLKDWGDSAVEVAGHTDKRNTSSAEYNQRLSEARAKSVSEYLVKHGIEAQRLTAHGYGFEQPVAENDPIEGNPANRRVELIRQKK